MGPTPAAEVRAVSRRIVIALIAVLSLAAVPSTAAAAHHRARARHHAARRRSRRHARKSAARSHAVVVAHHAAETGGSSSGGTEAANTVESFAGGVLKLRLAGGETVSGKVGVQTLLVCVTPPAQESGKGEGGEGDAEGGEGWGHEEGASGEAGAWQRDLARVRADGRSADSDADDDGQVQLCEASALTAGATVLYAQLAVGSSGAEWAAVILST